MLNRRSFVTSSVSAAAVLTTQGAHKAAAQADRRMIVDAQIHVWKAESEDWKWVPGLKPQLPEPFTIERAVLMAESNLIGVEDLTLTATKGDASSIDALGIKIPPSGIKLDDLERNTIIEALKMTNWVQKDAAELLGVSRRVLNYKVKIHNINHDRWRRKPEINN